MEVRGGDWRCVEVRGGERRCWSSLEIMEVKMEVSTHEREMAE